jgi:hypothetical protein
MPMRTAREACVGGYSLEFRAFMLSQDNFNDKTSSEWCGRGQKISNIYKTFSKEDKNKQLIRIGK